MRPPALAVPTVVAAAAVALFAASPTLAGSDRVEAGGPLTTYGRTLPAGASAELRVEYDAAGETRLDLEVAGLAPRTAYVVRAHVGGCTPRRSDLGEVFQQAPNPDPEQMPEDPAYRNPGNEVWLDVETDARGGGLASTGQPWQFHPAWRPGSVIIHSMLEARYPNDPVVGPALGCLEVAL